MDLNQNLYRSNLHNSSNVADQFIKKKKKEFLRYRDIFLPKKGKTKRTSIVKHKINAGDARRPKRQSAQ